MVCVEWGPREGVTPLARVCTHGGCRGLGLFLLGPPVAPLPCRQPGDAKAQAQSPGLRPWDSQPALPWTTEGIPSHCLDTQTCTPLAPRASQACILQSGDGYHPGLLVGASFALC